MNNEEKNKALPIVNPQGDDDEMLNILQKETFEYFLYENNLENGLVADKTQPGSACSIAATGMALSCYVVAVENNFFPRKKAVERILRTLSFFKNSKQGTAPDATGYKGFYYHFLNMKTGCRAYQCELSTIDTALLFAGILSASNYFTEDNEEENKIRGIAKELYERIDWQWALNNSDTISLGWKPESGFLQWNWNNGYTEAHILYVLALASPTFPINARGYKGWIKTFKWKEIYDIEYTYAGPLFIHQMSQIWLDFRGIKDDHCKKTGIDYFENSRRATHVQQQYAIENPLKFVGYDEHTWGITASDGPGPTSCIIDGVERHFLNYSERGVPYGPDDGTCSPWAVVASLPFAPKLVLKTVRNAIERLDLKKDNQYGFDASFNRTFPEKTKNPNGWVSQWQFGINQGPIVLMIENYKTGLLWKLMKKCPHITKGLRQAGFTGGWLDEMKED